jgi:hypothetical protein
LKLLKYHFIKVLRKLFLKTDLGFRNVIYAIYHRRTRVSFNSNLKKKLLSDKRTWLLMCRDRVSMGSAGTAQATIPPLFFYFFKTSMPLYYWFNFIFYSPNFIKLMKMAPLL